MCLKVSDGYEPAHELGVIAAVHNDMRRNCEKTRIRNLIRVRKKTACEQEQEETMFIGTAPLIHSETIFTALDTLAKTLCKKQAVTETGTTFTTGPITHQ